ASRIVPSALRELFGEERADEPRNPSLDRLRPISRRLDRPGPAEILEDGRVAPDPDVVEVLGGGFEERIVEEIEAVAESSVQGLYLQAYTRASKLAPLQTWRGTEARILAGRLAGNLGAPRLGRVLHFRAFRDDRRSLEALYPYAYAILDRRGPLDAWNALRPF